MNVKEEVFKTIMKAFVYLCILIGFVNIVVLVYKVIRNFTLLF